MAEQIQQTRRVNSDGTASVQTTEILDHSDNSAVAKDSVAARFVWFIAGVIAVLIAFRFVFILLRASSANGFANFIYSASHPLVAPFFGIFNYRQQYGSARFEWSSLVAIAVYLLVALGITKLLTIRRPRSV